MVEIRFNDVIKASAQVVLTLLQKYLESKPKKRIQLHDAHTENGRVLGFELHTDNIVYVVYSDSFVPLNRYRSVDMLELISLIDSHEIQE